MTATDHQTRFADLLIGEMFTADRDPRRFQKTEIKHMSPDISHCGEAYCIEAKQFYPICAGTPVTRITKQIKEA